MPTSSQQSPVIDASAIRDFQNRVLEWYKEYGRDLPWRHTTDPYAILISEIMLQQTQVDRVIPYYQRWLDRWPDWRHLAGADKKEVLQRWSGLGYNNRAIRLRTLAQTVVDDHQGHLPDEYDQLIALPGIGPYTARAILAFAHNRHVPVVDTNIRRVLIHELSLPEDITTKQIEQIAAAAVPHNKSRIWHNALMDYGAMEKTARSTGIRPTSRQSRFEGSDRQVRGHIIRTLVNTDHLLIADLHKQYGTQRTDRVIARMLKEEIITEEAGDLRLR